MFHDYPLVSILMPVYNAGRYLRAAVNSIQRQTLRDYEFIIVDGGSTDATPRLLARLARRDPRVRLIRHGRIGLADALNAGLAVARAPLVARMDADDVALPERLARQAQWLEGHPEVLGCGTAVALIDHHGAIVDYLRAPTDPVEIDQALMRGDSGAVFHSSLVVRRSALETIGGYRKFAHCSEDLDLYLRLSELGPLTNVPETLLHYRVHFQSTSFRRLAQQPTGKEAVLRDACRRRRAVFNPATADARYFQKAPVRFHREWAESAARLGHRLTAVKHALLAATLAPWDRANYVTLRRVWECLLRPARPAL